MVTMYSLRAKQYRTYTWFDRIDDRRIWHNIIDERKQFLNILHSKVDSKKRSWIGYNNWNFDDGVIVHLMRNPNITVEELWRFAQTLIRGDRNPYRYNCPFESYDCMEVIRAGFNAISLKGAAVNLKHEKIQDLPIPFDAEIQPEQIELMKEYNKNDVEITCKVLEYMRLSLEMRELLSESYKLNLHSLSDSGIGKELFSQRYIEEYKKKYPGADTKKIKYSRTIRETIDFKDVIPEQINFSTPQLQQYLQQLKSIKLTKDEIEVSNDG
ncbi:hypothetical protein [Scytonema sp. NUACC26]|uniref:hypothetical protein n=1 Tax=Scytonema sp. NUACC26 TaxID=3140176 RepID=UPI0038B378D9